MGSVFVVVGPVPGENLVGLAAEQEIEFLLEDAVELFAELLIEIGHRPAAELEALGRILGRPAGRLHDAIHGNLGADDDLPHGSLSLFEPTRAAAPGASPSAIAVRGSGEAARGQFGFRDEAERLAKVRCGTDPIDSMSRMRLET